MSARRALSDHPRPSATHVATCAPLAGAGVLTSHLELGLTALGTYTLCGGLYEATHFLAHTRVPLPPPLRAVRAHHMLHHTLSHDHWLAFTVPAVDSLFGTNPTPHEVASAQRARRQAERRQAAARGADAAPVLPGDDRRASEVGQ